MSVHDLNGEVICGAGCVRSFDGQKDFDKFYIDRVIKQVVKKTGDGEDDYILVEKIIESKRDIAKEIHSQSGDVGIDSYLKSFELTGESPIESFKGVSSEIVDYTKMPDNLADAQLLASKTGDLFASLPKDIVGRMSYEEFIQSFTQEKFDAYIKSLTPPVDEKKVEEKKDGEK